MTRLIGDASPVVPATNPTIEIRPRGDLPDLTVEAAERLLRSRLRQHLIARAAAIEHRSGHDDRAHVYELVLDAEKSIEVGAEAAWITTLGVWAGRWRYDHPRRWLRACVQHALSGAVEKSAAFIADRLAAYPGHDVDGWVGAFVARIEVDALLGAVMGTAFDRRLARP
jgi:hypothetical protein